MRRRGMALVLVLMVTALVLVLGLGLLSERASQYRGAVQASLRAAAQALAEAGLEDARVKPDRDPDFPPQGAEDQTVFAYTETVVDFTGDPVGSYEVVIDLQGKAPPWEVVRVTSTGTLGPEDNPQASHRTTLEIDVAPFVRGTTTPNPDLFRVINRE